MYCKNTSLVTPDCRQAGVSGSQSIKGKQKVETDPDPAATGRDDIKQ